ncbi:MAG: hypothetical protein J6V67_01690 [Campylobacter sp.]|uniref:hypothetical protein n=1 Tax=Campylobacter sp. TaxID=205 RepID=UPI001B0D4CCE|nr:hypothetical protein [Campylobacter sp.]MBO7154588.1 hypothetical protein [Campylobacter sp.]
MKKFAYLIASLLILMVGLHGYAYLFSNFVLSSAINKLKNSSEFTLSNINQNNSIFSSNLNFTLKYKDFNLQFNIFSHHSAISIFNGLDIVGDICDLDHRLKMDLTQNENSVLAKFNLNIPINGGISQLKAQISPLKIIENHNLFTISSIDISTTFDTERLYFLGVRFDKADFEFDGISSVFNGVDIEIDYLDGLEFASFDLFKFNPNELNISIKNLRANVPLINIVSDEVKFDSKTITNNLANIISNIHAKNVAINNIMIDNINSKIRLENLIIDSYKMVFNIMFGSKSIGLIDVFISYNPVLYVDKISINDLFELKFNLRGDSFDITDINLDGEFIALRPISTIKGLEFISFYENFLISSGILIKNGEGYISKFKSQRENGELIFNNSVKFSDILADF